MKKRHSLNSTVLHLWLHRTHAPLYVWHTFHKARARPMPTHREKLGPPQKHTNHAQHQPRSQQLRRAHVRESVPANKTSYSNNVSLWDRKPNLGQVESHVHVIFVMSPLQCMRPAFGSALQAANTDVAWAAVLRKTFVTSHWYIHPQLPCCPVLDMSRVLMQLDRRVSESAIVPMDALRANPTMCTYAHGQATMTPKPSHSTSSSTCKAHTDSMPPHTDD